MSASSKHLKPSDVNKLLPDLSPILKEFTVSVFDQIERRVPTNPNKFLFAMAILQLLKRSNQWESL